MADQHDGNASDDNTIIRSHRSSHPFVNARDRDEEIMPRALFLDFRDNNHHLDLESTFDHRIIIEIIRGHPICTALTKVELVPAIYLQQFWRTLQFHPTARPPRFTASIDHFNARITLRGIRRALNLPHFDNFEDPASEVQVFEDIHSLGYQDPEIPVLTGSSQFRRKHLPPIWYTLCSILNRCMTSKHTGIDKTNLPILRMFHAFTFNRNIDYAIIIWNEMIELVQDKARPKKDRNFVPFQRFFQILIHQAMEDQHDIPRREDAPRGPIQWMHRLIIPNHDPFAHIAVVREDVLAFADQESWVVKQYRIENALVVQPEPAGPPQDANPIGGEGQNVEGVQEPEVKRCIRKRVGRSTRTAGHASSSRPAQLPPRTRRPPVIRTDVAAASSADDDATSLLPLGADRDDVEEPFFPPFNVNDDDDDSNHNLMAHSIPRHMGKRPRVESSDADSTRNIELLDTATDAAGPSLQIEGVDVDVETVGSSEERGRKERSEKETEPEKVVITATLTENLSGSGVRPRFPSSGVRSMFPSLTMSQVAQNIGSYPYYITLEVLRALLASIDATYKKHIDELKKIVGDLSAEVKRAVKGKGIAESPSTSEDQPSRAESDTQTPPPIPLHLIPEDQLKSEILARLLARSDSNTAEEVDLISLLRQQTQPQPQAQTSTLTDAQFEKLQDSIRDMTATVVAGYQSLDKRIVIVEQACGVQAETSQKKRHDDQDDHDQHEGEKRTGGGQSGSAVVLV